MLETNETVERNSSGELREKANSKWIRKRWFLLLLIAIVFVPYLWLRVTSFQRLLTIESRRDQTVTFEGRLSVLTWNIAHGRGATDSNWQEGAGEKEVRIAEIAGKLREFDADLVILNEVDFNATWSGGYDQAKALAKQAGYDHVIKQSNLDFGLLFGRWNFGNVLLSRFPIKNAGIIELEPVNAWEPWVVGCKRGFRCEVELDESTVIGVVGLHLESRGEKVRVKQVDNVANGIVGIPNVPIIVAGDLNTTPKSFPDSRTNSSGVNAFDKLVGLIDLERHPGLEPDAENFTFATNEPKSIIDWILFRNPPGIKTRLKPTSNQVMRNQLSDHFAVLAQFEIVE